MKHATQLNRLLIGPGKENPGLLSSEWTTLDEFFALPIDAQKRLLQAAIDDPRASGPLIRAMRIIIDA